MRKYSVRKRNISAPVSSKISSKAGSAPLKRARIGTAALSSVQLCFSCLRTLSNHFDWVISGNSLKIYEEEMAFNSSLQALKSNPYWSVFVSFLLQSTKTFHKFELLQAEDGFSLHAVPFQQQLYTKVYLVLRLSQNLQQQGAPDHRIIE